MQTVQKEGVIGLGGSTRMDPKSQFPIQGKALGEFGVQINKPMVPTNLVDIVVGPGMGMWDRKNQKNTEQRKIQHPSKFGKLMFSEKYKEQNDRIGNRSIDSKARWTHFHWKFRIRVKSRSRENHLFLSLGLN